VPLHPQLSLYLALLVQVVELRDVMLYIPFFNQY